MNGDATRDRRLAALMRAAQAGDGSAYRALLTEVTPLLRRAVRARNGVLQPQDVEDLVQDILLSLHAARGTYDPARAFLPWLMAIARNRMADGARRYARRSANEVAMDPARDETFAAPEANSSDEVYGDPEALRAALRCLPPGQREAVEMLKLRELSLKEASTVTGTSVGALKVAVHRGVRSLRLALKREA